MSNNFFKTTTIFFFAILLQNCNAQDYEKEFQGNWQIMEHEKNSVIYQEVYVDNQYIYYYDLNLGLLPRNRYYFEDNSLMQSELGSDFEKAGKIKFQNNDEFILTTGDGEIHYKRLKDRFLLSDFISEKIEETVYTESFFNRMQDWENR